MPLPVTYLLVLAFQVPVWLGAGLLWGAAMAVFSDMHPVNAIVGGVVWSLLMWVLMGNLVAIGLVWRRSAEFTASDRVAFRAALGQVCGKLQLVVLAESADEVVLGPKRAFVRFRLQEIRVEFAGGTATLTAPAMSLGPVRKALRLALAVTPEQQT